MVSSHIEKKQSGNATLHTYIGSVMFGTVYGSHTAFLATTKSYQFLAFIYVMTIGMALPAIISISACMCLTQGKIYLFSLHLIARVYSILKLFTMQLKL